MKTLGLTSILLLAFAPQISAADALPGWQDTDSRNAIVSFVESVTDPTQPTYVPVARRIAVFDNDGTLWAEQPLYFQLFFALDRVRELAAQHPEWQDEQPFKAAIENDRDALIESGKPGLLKLVGASHAGNTPDEFRAIVNDWLADARHPERGVPFTDLVYQPMQELINYLRDSGFRVFIVSGGGIEFMRAWTERVYGIPPHQVVGSSIRTEYRERDGEPVIVRLPEVDFVDDKEGKPIGINRHIGQRPLIAVGNSDGDYAMLDWTTAGEGPRLGILVRHTDAEREWRYDRDSSIGRLDRGLDDAPDKGWLIVDMKNDWRYVFEVND